ncbi:MAG: hypothetical protein ACLUFL_02725 [Flavonifractor plautii]
MTALVFVSTICASSCPLPSTAKPLYLANIMCCLSACCWALQGRLASSLGSALYDLTTLFLPPSAGSPFSQGILGLAAG